MAENKPWLFTQLDQLEEETQLYTARKNNSVSPAEFKFTLGQVADWAIQRHLSQRVSRRFIIDATTAGNTLILPEAPDTRDLMIFKNATPNFFETASDVTVNEAILTWNYSPLEVGDIVRVIYTKKAT